MGTFPQRGKQNLGVRVRRTCQATIREKEINKNILILIIYVYVLSAVISHQADFNMRY